MELSDLITSAVIPAVAGIGGWLAGGHKRRNDAIRNMQETIDLLVEKNGELTEQVVALRKDNAALRSEIEFLIKNKNNEN